MVLSLKGLSVEEKKEFKLMSTKKNNVFGLVVWLMILSISANEYGRVNLRTRAGDYVQVGQNGRFKIILFADLHFGEDAWTPWGPRQDANSLRLMSTLLDRELPDFVIYLGDIITANNIPVQNASLYWDKAISPTRHRGIPFTTIFGNHDDAPFEWPIEWFSSPGIPEHHCSTVNASHPGYTEGKSCSFRGTTRLDLVRAEIQRNSFSYSKSGPSILWPSVSNYVIKISSPSDPELPVAFMYFLDSGGGSYPEVLSSAQADWFKQKSLEVNPNSRIPEIIFWHIPSKAYKKVAPSWFYKGKCVGSMFKESVAAQEEETGIMKLLEARPSVKAVFVGHNHGLDWCCPHKKLWLCYARHSGYGGYGNWPRGARILEITEKPLSLKSWIRMEDGTSHSKVVLSS